MSKTIQQEKHFLQLLLNTTKDQARGLLYTITPKQVLAISEIAHNLLQLPLPNNIKSVIQKRKRALKKIGNKDSSVRNRSMSIKKHITQLLDTLKLAKTQLKQC